MDIGAFILIGCLILLVGFAACLVGMEMNKRFKTNDRWVYDSKKEKWVRKFE